MHRTICGLLCAASTSWLTAAEEQPSGHFVQLRAPDPPNIILIVASQLSVDDLSCYGATNASTPQIDRLAKEGIRFLDCYAGAGAAELSQATLFQGLHTGHLKTGTNLMLSTDAPVVMLPEFLKSIGYKTGGAGSWALAEIVSPGKPSQRGFDDWVGVLDPKSFHDYYPATLTRVQGAAERTVTTSNQLAGPFLPNVMAFVRSNYVRVTKYSPFYLHYSINLPGPDRVPAASRPVPPRSERLKMLDREVGALLSQLKTLDIDMATAVFLTSDQPLSKSAQSSALPELTPETLRVPLLVRWPGKTKPGRVSEVHCALWDLYPTAAQMAKTNAPAGLDGISLLPTLLGQTQTNQHKALYWKAQKGDEIREAVRVGEWHRAGDRMIHVPQTEPGDETRLEMQPVLKASEVSREKENTGGP